MRVIFIVIAVVVGVAALVNLPDVGKGEGDTLLPRPSCSNQQKHELDWWVRSVGDCGRDGRVHDEMH
ncbi:MULTISPECIES: hypothetical protein [Bradyrhizobium]|uniref:hypothetical protein n=1 Tax=Bradyrhizobium brasilense TaxID=1419277 RepID=UPI001457965C|nr:hypothetical protein [Bradyrhizobium brasilense]NLS69149.1 hypothetical protein [Bradyrhizobium brasilense]